MLKVNASSDADLASPFEVNNLATFARWLFGETGRAESEYAHECMELFSALIKLLPGRAGALDPARTLVLLTDGPPTIALSMCGSNGAETTQSAARWMTATFPGATAVDLLDLYRPDIASDALEAHAAVPAAELQRRFQELCRSLVNAAVAMGQPVRRVAGQAGWSSRYVRSVGSALLRMRVRRTATRGCWASACSRPPAFWMPHCRCTAP